MFKCLLIEFQVSRAFSYPFNNAEEVDEHYKHLLNTSFSMSVMFGQLYASRNDF